MQRAVIPCRQPQKWALKTPRVRGPPLVRENNAARLLNKTATRNGNHCSCLDGNRAIFIVRPVRFVVKKRLNEAVSFDVHLSARIISPTAACVAKRFSMRRIGPEILQETKSAARFTDLEIKPELRIIFHFQPSAFIDPMVSVASAINLPSILENWLSFVYLDFAAGSCNVDCNESALKRNAITRVAQFYTRNFSVIMCKPRN